MNPINKVAGAIAHPMRTATSVAGGALGVAAAGVRTATRIVQRGEQADSPSAPETAESHAPSGETSGVSPTLAVARDGSATPEPEARSAEKSPAEKSPAKKSPAKKSPAKKRAATKSPARKSPAKKAPSAKVATAAPALTPESAPVPDAPVPDAPVPDALVDDQATHVETETEVVYSSETGSPATGEDHLTEPLLDPAVAEQLRSGTADSDKG